MKLLRLTASLLVFFTLAGCGLMRGEGNRFAEGISVNGVELSNLTKAEAEEKLRAKSEEMLDKELVFSYREQSFPVKLSKVGVSTNFRELIEQIYTHSSFKGQTLSLGLEYRVDLMEAAEKVAVLTQGLNSAPKDAVFRVSLNNKIEVIPHAPGIEVDAARAAQDILPALDQERETVQLVVKESEPAIKTKDLEAQKFDGLLAAFSTSFKTTDKNRTENMKMAVRAIDMMVLKPGEVFSFNAVSGPKTQEAGYKEAPVIVDNELVPGIGGGVCQVSSTLYNLVLLADLEVLERHPHQFAVAYLPPGRDAMVMDAYADLRFKNNTPALVLLRAEVKGNKLNMRLFGKKTNKKVAIQTVVDDTKPMETERILDSALPPGKVVKDQPGARGYSTRTYRVVKVNNKETKREEISKDTYKPSKQVIRIGPPRSRGAAVD